MKRVVITLTAALAPALAPRPAVADTQLWSELQIRHRPTKRLRLALAQHLRLDDGVSRIGAVIPEAGLRYKLRQWLRLGAGYRFELARDGGGELDRRHRLHADAIGRARIGAFEPRLRIRLQRQLRGVDGQIGYRDTARARLSLGWRAGRGVEPFAATEVFARLDSERISKLRFTAGSDLGDAELSVRVEAPTAPDEPVSLIVAAGYRFRL
jgi:hypothetical protein